MRQSSKRDKVHFRFMRGRRRNFFSKLGMGLISDFQGGRLGRLSSYIFKKKCVCVRGRVDWPSQRSTVLFDLFDISSGWKLLGN